MFCCAKGGARRRQYQAGSGGGAGAGANAKEGGVGINKAGDGGSDHEVLVWILVVVLEVEALLMGKGGVLRTVVVVEVLLRVVVVVEEQVLGVLVAKEHVRVVVVEVLKMLKRMVVVSEGGQYSEAVAAASVNSGDTWEEEIWTASSLPLHPLPPPRHVPLQAVSRVTRDPALGSMYG